ncbi:MAG: pyroglutamyl-peptidase I [Bacilli bacterium]|nr:pyroglutamyl-peptidase I [Bacilli bacterium]
MKIILLTGFEPFGGESINPSWELVKLFDNQVINDYRIISKELPTVFYESSALLLKYLKEYEPRIVLCFGQAGGSNSIRLERVAVNVNDARIPDNKGNQPLDELIDSNGSVAYFTKLPIRLIYDKLTDNNLPVSISLSAGSYVCNHVFYQLMQVIHDKDIIGGFIHIPYLNIQNKPNHFNMSMDELQKALDIILKSIIDYD